MQNETPQQKASRLGIPLIVPIERIIPDQDTLKESGKYKDAMLSQIAKPIAICGGCGKEITQQDAKNPCGANNCPFGYLTN